MIEKIYIGDDAIHFAVEQLIEAGRAAIAERGWFILALSGGSTPKAIYQELAARHQQSLNWRKVRIFFSDERCVPPTSNESNYKMAMENGIASLGIPENQIYRMKGEMDPPGAAREYQDWVVKHVPDQKFDLILLGMGEDGHTASLFPDTSALQNTEDLVVSNFVPKLNVHRLTFTYRLINQAIRICIPILGESKAPMVKEIFSGEKHEKMKRYPIQGVDFTKTLFILNPQSASLIPNL